MYDRLLNKSERPSEEDILSLIGEGASLWQESLNYVNEQYDCESELKFFTKKYGWMIRYRKSNRTLCSFFPEENAFSVLIVLGAKESEKVELKKSELNDNFRTIFDETEQLRDGKWMWVRLLNQSDLESLIIFLNSKRKPKSQK